MLREAAAEFRRAAETESDPQLSILAACMLEQRAERIADGEDDHSDVPVDIGVKPEASESTAHDSDPSAAEPESRAG